MEIFIRFISYVILSNDKVWHEATENHELHY